ncbi:hypothetical protein [Bradyrhizobium sp. S69]|uniref:hypothetical protein n=1 Tax=Bradyrhizobium sp. S69 TaxID=1641856 RepID=UPI00131A963B|nr:hypothetical protein [Bradyrhizobium sp. S69]
MRSLLLRYFAITACLAAAALPARATSNHHYAKGEYGIIRHGLAPGKQLSLASHGEGELGDEGFHVWLMAEPAHRRIAKLDAVSSDNNLDTDPGAYHAFWSKDSRHVGVGFRSERYIVTLNLYRIEDRRAHLIAGPSLFKEVTSREVADADDLRVRNSIVEWHGGKRFLFREYLSFVADDDRLVKLLGSYGRVAAKLDDGKLVIEFHADAECELLPGDRTRVIDLKPGDSDNW